MDTAIQQRPMLTLRGAAQRLNVSEKDVRRLVAESRACRGSRRRSATDRRRPLEAWIALASSNGDPE